MTNEMTAKEAVKQIKENCYFASISEKTKQALDKAIKALEAQRNITNEELYQGFIELETENERLHDALEAQPSEDCVSREALIDKATSWDTHFADSERYVSLSDIIAMPSVYPERSKGRWIGHGEHCENLGVMPSGLGAYEWCSNCDCGIDVSEWHRNHYNFCPNCGADMRGEGDES